MEAKITARIAELEAARVAFVEQAARQLGAFDGAILELRRLLSPSVVDSPAVPVGDEAARPG